MSTTNNRRSKANPATASKRKTTPKRAGPKKSKEPSVRLERILVPVDFSDRSRCTLQYAVGFARVYGAHLFLLHVVEPIVYPADMGFAPLSLQSLDINLKDSSATRLGQWVTEEVPPDIAVDARVQVGPAYIEITNYARKIAADLIIISTHGYTGLKHVLLGSTAERVVRHAECPVLTIRQG